MESWGYASEGKGLLFSDELDLSVDAFTKSRKSLTVWDKESVESMGFVDLGLSELLKKPSNVGNTGGVGIVSFAERGSDSSGKVVVTSPNCILGSNSSLESVSNLSNSFVDSNSQDSPLIDLKLGRFVDCKDGLDRKFYEERSVISSANQTIPAKRARAAGSRMQTPFCQVYGCNKDLSFSKDYHKRHKVCEVHSKTPKVIVNGIEQRFCQQCSRFHLLLEFDEGKRSCRKRLAGHNERRRKPQFSALSIKPQKLLHSYQGTKFLETSLPKRASFLFPDIVPGGVLYPERSEQASWSRNVKVEEREIYNPRIGISKTSGQLSPKSLLHLNDYRIQSSTEISSAPTANYVVFNAASTTNELAGVPHSSCALSLLSAESQELGYLSGNVVDRPSISQASRAHQSSIISDKTLGMWYSQKNVSNDFISSGMTSTETNHIGSFMVSDIGYDAANHQTEADSFPQALDFLNTKYCVSPDRGSTVNLLELSSHLQRVEQQRNSMHVKQENEDFYRFVQPTRFENEDLRCGN